MAPFPKIPTVASTATDTTTNLIANTSSAYRKVNIYKKNNIRKIVGDLFTGNNSGYKEEHMGR